MSRASVSLCPCVLVALTVALGLLNDADSEEELGPQGLDVMTVRLGMQGAAQPVSDPNPNAAAKTCFSDFCSDNGLHYPTHVEEVDSGTYTFEVTGFFGAARDGVWYVNDIYQHTDNVRAPLYTDPQLEYRFAPGSTCSWTIKCKIYDVDFWGNRGDLMNIHTWMISLSDLPQVSNVDASDNIEAYVKVTWTGVQGANNYVIYRGSNGSLVYRYDEDSASPYYDSEAIPGTRYCYAVQAENDCVDGPVSVGTFGIRPAPCLAPGTPNTPSGSSTRDCNEAGTYSTGGSSCASGCGSVQYQFDWGDSISSWGSSSQSYSWNTCGTHCVKARARCSENTGAMSGWSSCKNVTISGSCCNPGQLTIQRTAGTGTYPAAGGSINVAVSFSATGAIYSLALKETVPSGWTYGGYVSGPSPAIQPNIGAGGVLEFAWTTTPTFPTTFSYGLSVPSGQSGQKQIQGWALYVDGQGEDQETEVLTTTLEPSSSTHSADSNGDYMLSLEEVLRVIAYYNAGQYHCDSTKPDGYNVGSGSDSCGRHDADYDSTAWEMSLQEVLRPIAYYNAGGYHPDPTKPDGFNVGRIFNAIMHDVLRQIANPYE